MKIDLRTLDRKMWRKDQLAVQLWKSHYQNEKIEIEMWPEGSCATALRLYSILDEFCSESGYPKKDITINTGNMLEYHPEYSIRKDASCWYEVQEIQDWMQGKEFTFINRPKYHFANFISRSNWYRLWTATTLWKHHSNKTLQTYHYDRERENYNANGYVGLDDLVTRDCDMVSDAAEFINHCPRTLDIEYLQDLENCKDSIFQHENSYYPIQHPSNLNLLQYYKDIFVDIVCEPNISGNCFLITEKLWRCILARRPFIVVSNMHYLQNLKLLGFKTFSDYWSEDYDGYGDQSRILQIQDLINDISEYSLSRLSLILDDMKPVLDHNFTTFLSLTPEKILEVFN